MGSGRQESDWMKNQISIFDLLGDECNEGLSDRGSKGHRRQGKDGSPSLVCSAESVPAHGGCNQTRPGDRETTLSRAQLGEGSTPTHHD